ncbi:histidinol-phosphatase [Mangrovicella endophytica]|uniref:histidinol-phosphatase n=1 Tax=Mangrovicella endophytica TaxID=2066697 RepID=UPI000C9DC6AE|nr:histidinol-phosphatase [Mangrovicella endophytica]
MTITLPSADFLMTLMDAADAETLPLFRQDLTIDNKILASFDPVTEADRAAERAIRDVIAAAYPDHAILGEEYGTTGKGPYQWVIDPIDGTRAFISGLPVWGTLVGLTVQGKARIGVMSQPFTRERFYADGNGAHMVWPGGKRTLSVRPTTNLSEATLFTTTPRLFTGEMLPRFEALERRARLTRFGVDCYAFAMLAAGQADLVVETGLQPYDIVALIPIIEQAGGIVSALGGGAPEAGGTIIAAATAALHDEAVAVLSGSAG